MTPQPFPDMKQLGALLLITALFSIQCRPDPEPEPQPTENFSEIIVSGPWKVDFQDLVNGTFVSVTQDCMKDDTWTFHTNTDYEISESTNLCDPGQPYGGIAGNWSLKNNDTQVLIELDFDDLTLDIGAFGPNEVILNQPPAPGGTVNSRVVLTK